MSTHAAFKYYLIFVCNLELCLLTHGIRWIDLRGDRHRLIGCVVSRVNNSSAAHGARVNQAGFAHRYNGEGGGASNINLTSVFGLTNRLTRHCNKDFLLANADYLSLVR